MSAVYQFQKQGFEVEPAPLEKLRGNDLIRKIVLTNETSEVILLKGQRDASLVFNGTHPTKQDMAVMLFDDDQNLLLVTGMIIYGFSK